MIVGYLPHMGDFLAVGRQHVPGESEIRQHIVAPDPDRLQLHIPGIPVFPVAHPAGIHPGLEGRIVHPGVQTVGGQHLPQTIHGFLFGCLVHKDVLQGSAHIK